MRPVRVGVPVCRVRLAQSGTVKAAHKEGKAKE